MQRSLALKWEGGCLGCGFGCATLIAAFLLLGALFGLLPDALAEHARTVILIASAVLLCALGLSLTGRGKSFIRARVSVRKRSDPNDPS